MLSRRSFLKAAGAALVGAAFMPRLSRQPMRYVSPWMQSSDKRLGLRPVNDWPVGPDKRLGRMCWPWGVSLMSRPNPQGIELGKLYPEEVVTIVRDVVGQGMAYHTHVWNELETGGYVYAPYLQPVHNAPQPPLTTLLADGVWGEISIPYIDARTLPQTDAPVVYRLYYSGVFRILEIVLGLDGAPWYRLTMETGIHMHVPAETVRPIPADELTPISPDVTNKRIVVHMQQQALSAFEGQTEVYRARISSGANYFGEDGKTLLNGTPGGERPIWQKRISRHMQGGTIDNGYDVPGVGWVCYFASNGAALHSTYWHNDFGIPKSHGCLNCRPEDAKWLFRWTMPLVPYQPGDITVDWDHRGTTVDIRMEA